MLLFCVDLLPRPPDILLLLVLSSFFIFRGKTQLCVREIEVSNDAWEGGGGGRGGVGTATLTNHYSRVFQNFLSSFFLALNMGGAVRVLITKCHVPPIK